MNIKPGLLYVCENGKKVLVERYKGQDDKKRLIFVARNVENHEHYAYTLEGECIAIRGTEDKSAWKIKGIYEEKKEEKEEPKKADEKTK